MNEDDDPIVGYEENEPGILTIQRKDGQSLTVRDQDGTTKGILDAIIQKNNSGTPRPGGLPDQTGIAPQAAAPLGGGVEAPAMMPSPSPGLGPTPEPTPPPGLLPSGYGLQGVAPQSRQEIGQAGQQFDTAAGIAGQSQLEAAEAQNQAQMQALEMQRAQAEVDTIQAKDRISRYQSSLKENMAAQEAAQQRPIDTSKAFGGPRGWFSAIAAIATDRSNMHAALAGMPTQPNKVLEDLIDDSVRQQEAQKKIDMGATGELVGLDRANLQQAELDMREAAKRQLLADVGKLQGSPLQAKAQADLDAFNAGTEERKLKRAEGLAATQTQQFAPPAPVKSVTQNQYAESEGANRVKLEGLKEWSEQSGIPLKDAHKKYEEVGGWNQANAEVLESERAILDLIKGSSKTGDVAGLGYLDNLAPNWVTSDEGRGVRQEFRNMLDSFGRIRTGAAMPDSEVKLFERIAAGDFSPGDIRHGIEIMTRQAHSQEKELNAEFPGLTKLYGKVSGVNRSQSVSDIRKTAIRTPEAKASTPKPETSSVKSKFEAEKSKAKTERDKRDKDADDERRDTASSRGGYRSGGGRF